MAGIGRVDEDDFAEIAVTQGAVPPESSRGIVYLFSGAPDDVVLPGATDQDGHNRRTLAVPADPSLLGSTFFLQWCVLQPSSAPQPAVLTRALRCRVSAQ